MKTPQELKLEEDRKDEQRKAQIESNLANLVASSTGKITSKGGVIEYPGYSWEDWDIVVDFFRTKNWQATYAPRIKYDYSMTAKSEYGYNVHAIQLTPIV